MKSITLNVDGRDEELGLGDIVYILNVGAAVVIEVTQTDIGFETPGKQFHLSLDACKKQCFSRAVVKCVLVHNDTYIEGYVYPGDTIRQVKDGKEYYIESVGSEVVLYCINSNTR